MEGYTVRYNYFGLSKDLNLTSVKAEVICGILSDKRELFN